MEGARASHNLHSSMLGVGIASIPPPSPLTRTTHPPSALNRQVGASNELPESEELDALYDRFLIRRNVAQVGWRMGGWNISAGSSGIRCL